MALGLGIGVGLLSGCGKQQSTEAGPTDPAASGGSTSTPTQTPTIIESPPPPGAGEPIACGDRTATSPAVTDFSVWDATLGTWGTADGQGLSGGWLNYGDIGSSENTGTASLINGQVDTTQPDPSLELAGTVSTYAGFILWMSSCLDASAYAGVEFDLLGTLPEGVQLQLQLQTNENYPVDEEQMRGACEFTDLTARWLQCLNPAAVADVPSGGGVVTVPWDAFSGGQPDEGANPAELLGFQWQFVCETAGTPCAIDVSIDNLRFFSAAVDADAGTP